MRNHEPGEARAWALDQLVGCCGCVMPTFTSDLSKLNEAAIRHDVALEKAYGMTGVLIVSECGTNDSEMAEFVRIVTDEAGDELVTILQASQPTLAHTIESVQDAADVGVDLVLLSYPLTWYPVDQDEVYAFTKAVAECSPMGLIVFAMHLWNLGRFHPSEFDPALLRKLVDTCPNVVGIKNEIGGPGVGGISQVFELFRDEVIVTDPLEMNAPAWARAYGMRFMGTSVYECMADQVPRYFDLLHQPGGYDEAMEIYWRIHPMRQTMMRIASEASAGTGMVHRLLWKYCGWLMGFNGGPIRQPQDRLFDHQMQQLRAAGARAGLPVHDDDDATFFRGRNP